MRNVGGSVGIAAVATALTRLRVTHAAALASHVSVYDPNARAVFGQLQQAFGARGLPDATALAAMNGMVQRQASMLAFIDMFRWLGAIFLLLIPLVFVMRRSHGRRAPVAVVAE